MRKLLWFTVGFAIACFTGIYLVSFGWFLFAFIAAGLATTCILLHNGNCKIKITAAVLLGCAVGFCWLGLFEIGYLRTARDNNGKTISGIVEISDYSYSTDYGYASDGTIILDGKRYQTKVYLQGEGTLSPGDRVQGNFRLRLTVEDGEGNATYHPGKGIYLLLYADEDVELTYGKTVPGKYFPSALRRNILNLIDQMFPKDTLAFARALLLGDSSMLTYEEDTAFKISGIRHVIAVSGLHVSILFSVVYLLTGKKRGLLALIGLPALLLFAAVAGFTPSVVRACIMQGLMILALLVNKEYDPPSALAFAALVLMAVNPMVITSVSFQLSVGCIIGILLFSGKIHSYLLQEKRLGTGKGKGLKARLVRWIASSVSVSVSAMIVTTPLSAYYFGTVSLVSILANLLVLWVISFAFYGIVASCVLGAIWLPLGKLIAAVISVPVRYVLAVSKLLASFPLAAVYTCSVYILLWLIFTYCLLMIFLLFKRKHPVVLVLCVAASLACSVMASWVEPKLDHYRVTVLDVGQGQSILLQSGGRTYLVDCGGDTDAYSADTAAQMLLSQGITSIDGLILTHYDQDHAGGAEAFLSRIPADALYLPDTDHEDPIRISLLRTYEKQTVLVGEPTVLSCDDVSISLFPAEDGDDDNENSMCILFQAENCDILITGDRSAAGELALISQTELPELEILVVGHHGSNSSTGIALLKETSPAVAVISAGKANSYGHPAKQVLDRLSMYGCKIFRTDQKGTIVFRG